MSSPHRKREGVQVHESDVLSGESCRYLVRNLKGEGSFGKVARCIKLDTMEIVAVKIVRKHLTWAGKKEASAFKQICILDLNKSNVVTFFESFMHEGHMCLVLEMLDITLHDLMREKGSKPLCLSEIRAISQQMLVALNALKSIGLLHGDIKPDNVMLVNHQVQPFRVKLIDFGYSAPVSKVKRRTTVQTLGYRAPEVILGLPIDEAVDMWSLGCVLAYMYLRKHLYPTRCEYEVIRIIVQMQGQPDDHLLDAGIRANIFFSKNKDTTKQVWRLNTQSEYTLATGLEIQQSRSISNKYTCMDDMTKNHPEPKTNTEHEDTRAFLSLFKRMLRVDSVTRITPTDALGHRFITMRHFPTDSDPDPYVASSRVNMEVCSPGEISCFKSSSEVSHGRASTTGSPSAGLDDKANPGTNDGAPASADTTTKGSNNGTDDAVSPAPVYPNEVNCGSDGRTTSTPFITVKTRRTTLKRNRGFCSMCCCCIDVEE